MSADLTGQLLGHYLVQAVIGRGGMSVVYRGIDQRLQRAVALKVMSEDLSADPEFRTRFLEEARAASAIDHVNVVPLYDFGEADGALFIAMRLVDGTDLARELAAGPMPVRRVLALLGQVGAALDVLHERGLVHLDVKPANVLITRNESVGKEHVYLADFGLTRRGAGGHRTAAGDFLGSPSYASPEHLRGGQIGPASDEYSMTCLLFAALAGRPPHVGDVRAVITGHLSGVAPSLSALTDLPPAVDRVVARGLAADPGFRYGSISDLLTALRRAIVEDDESPPALDAGSGPSGSSFLPPVAPPTQPMQFRPPVGAPPGAAPGTFAQHPSPGFEVRRQSAAAPQHRPAETSHPSGTTPVAALPADRAAPPVLQSTGQQFPRQQFPRQQFPGQVRVRPEQFAGVGQHRPAAHRVEPARARWPWLVAAALVVLLAGVLVLVAMRSSGTDGLRLPGSQPPVITAAPPVATAAPR